MEKSEKQKSQKGETARKIKNAASKTVQVAAVLAPIMIMTGSVLQDSGIIEYGKSQVDSYMKTLGKKVLTLDTEKTWADYAWEEMTK